VTTDEARVAFAQAIEGFLRGVGALNLGCSDS
jgi:hypothetical protein